MFQLRVNRPNGLWKSCWVQMEGKGAVPAFEKWRLPSEVLVRWPRDKQDCSYAEWASVAVASAISFFMTQPSLSSGLIFNTFTYPALMQAVVEDVHCTSTGGATHTRRTTPCTVTTIFWQMVIGGLEEQTPFSISAKVTIWAGGGVPHISEAVHELVPLSATPVLLSICLNCIPPPKATGNSTTSVKAPLSKALPPSPWRNNSSLLCFHRTSVSSNSETPDALDSSHTAPWAPAFPDLPALLAYSLACLPHQGLSSASLSS